MNPVLVNRRDDSGWDLPRQNSQDQKPSQESVYTYSPSSVSKV